jgi:hypothetical protein
LLLFQVPFDEDDKDKSVWFLDHDYLENMYGMFKKVNGKYICDILLRKFGSLAVENLMYTHQAGIYV